MTTKQQVVPSWLKLTLLFGGGVATPFVGNKLVTDSPVHILVDGEKPAGADAEWDCQPEGGLIGAPMVCRPKAKDESTATKKE